MLGTVLAAGHNFELRFQRISDSYDIFSFSRAQRPVAIKCEDGLFLSLRYYL